MMGHPMVGPAQQQQVREGRWPTLRPVDHVVRVAPGLRTVAAGESAVAVPHDDRPTHGGWHDRRPAAHVERF